MQRSCWGVLNILHILGVESKIRLIVPVTSWLLDVYSINYSNATFWKEKILTYSSFFHSADVPDLNIIVNTQSTVGSIVIYGDPVVNLTCIAVNASSQLAVDWMKHGKRLEQQNERMITRFVKNQNSIMTSNVSIVLQEDFTNVSCVSSGESELQRRVTSLVIQYYGENLEHEYKYSGS